MQVNTRKRRGAGRGAASRGAALLGLLLLSHAVAQETPAPMPTEPEAHWIYPLGGRPGTRLKAEVEGRLLEEVHAVWSPEPGLRGAILEVRPGPERTPEAEAGADGDKGKARTQRVALQLEIGPGVRSGIHSLHLVSRQGGSNPLSFLVSSDPVMEESGDTPRGASEPQAVRPPVILNGRISRNAEVDTYAVEVAAGEDLSFQLFSPAETYRPILRLYREEGSWLQEDKLAELEFSQKGSYRASRAKRWRHRFNRAGRYLMGLGRFTARPRPTLSINFALCRLNRTRDTRTGPVPRSRPSGASANTSGN